jgi:hypothetical protein
MATPDRASKPIARYNSPAEDPKASLVYDNTNTSFVELSQTMKTNLKHCFKSLECHATIHNMKTIVQVASPSHKTYRNMDLPTREESRTLSKPSTHTLPSGSFLMPNSKWGSRKGGGGGEDGEEKYPPPSPNSNNKNDENARANHSNTHLGDVPPTTVVQDPH